MEGLPIGSEYGARLRIDLVALADNWRQLDSMAPGAETGAVVKADAYGVGINQAVPALAAAGCKTFFVATMAEGVAVRQLSPDVAIYVLNGLPVGAIDEMVGRELRPILNSWAEIAEWAAASPKSPPPGIQFDTGMNRLGLSQDDARALAADTNIIDNLDPALVMSHLACADERSNPNNNEQLSRFRALRELFPSVPASLANSAGILLGAPFQFDLTRPGIALYGAAAAEKKALRSVVTAEAPVLQIRVAEAGETVGYGARQTLRQTTRLATLGVGYADGYLRAAGSADDRVGAHVFIRGRRAPLVGRISMDLMVADVTNIPGVERGDWAELFGDNVMIDDVADRAGTIGYELLTDLGRRYSRHYDELQPQL
ncbi:MAG: alanine racemase [Alphaproteobacteria bacterium]